MPDTQKIPDGKETHKPQHLNDQSIIEAASGLVSLLRTFRALDDPDSPLSEILGRLALLAKAAWLPDSGTANLEALSLLLGISKPNVGRTAATETDRFNRQLRRFRLTGTGFLPGAAL